MVCNIVKRIGFKRMLSYARLYNRYVIASIVYGLHDKKGQEALDVGNEGQQKGQRGAGLKSSSGVAYFRPAASRSRAALSVFSHGKCSRPK
ncbi:Uncharacterised protein [Klebsiella aerogenes]|nr:hypothetical protein AF47_02553 [Klebsiella aerogenes MGH 61]VEI07802.1 Uncharacterised protein [Klebsiella aerogenes]